MEHTLLLSVPEDIYVSLMKRAAETGQSPEHLAVQWLTAGSRAPSPRRERDPLNDIIGCIDTGISDWGTNHDWYIRQGILESIRGAARKDDPSDA
jgi:hypothetical protein